MLIEALRHLVVEHSRLLVSQSLTRGTGGNISAINEDRSLVAITPSGVPYSVMTASDVCVVDLDGKRIDGDLLPSSELDLHLECYRRRLDVGSVVHSHSTYATVMACLGLPLQPIHYLIGFAGEDVPVTPYEVFGTAELARLAVDVMGDRNAVLLGNHGLLAVGRDLPSAFNVAEEIEFVAEIYYKTLCVGGGKLIEDDLFKASIAKFASYGQQVSALKADEAR